MTDGDRQRISRVIGLWYRVETQDRFHHPLHLRLVGSSVAAHCVFHMSGRVLVAVQAGFSGSDEHGASRLPDRQRDAGVGADV